MPHPIASVAVGVVGILAAALAGHADAEPGTPASAGASSSAAASAPAVFRFREGPIMGSYQPLRGWGERVPEDRADFNGDGFGDYFDFDDVMFRIPDGC
jgi:hypothetical protein